MAFGSELLNGYWSLGDDVNKVHDGKIREQEQGAVTDYLDELRLDMDDEELIALKKKWEVAWEPYEKDILQIQSENEKYWIGQQHPGLQYRPTERPLTDNLIFESLETYLPLATKNNPEPIVEGDGTDEGTEQAKISEKYLSHLSKKLVFKEAIKTVARYWATYLLGVGKIGWSYADNEISFNVPRPQRLILDPDATINYRMEYEGKYIGEVRKDTGEYLLERFAKKKVPPAEDSEIVEKGLEKNEAYDEDIYNAIFEECQGKFGTEIQYQEWWTPKYVFWTLKKNVLGKSKNPHWNYQGKPQTITDPTGKQIRIPTEPKNHFKQPKMPYMFLSVFNIGKHPHDDTTLITQNLSKQDVINKRQRQIDKNVDWMNGGWAISGERSGLTRDEATNAVDAARKGGGIWVPQGDVNAAVVRLTGTGLPADVFQNLNDMRQEVRNSFGTAGTAPQSVKQEGTMGGKILLKTADGDRMSGISTRLETFAEQFYNWCLQLICVYYTEPHKATIVGESLTQESIQIDNQTITSELTVTVKDGSLVPKDPIVEANQAADLGREGLIDPLTFFQKLDFANPKESAERFILYKANLPAYVQKYFPDLAQLFQPQPPQAKPPNESINFADISPEAQSQMLAKVGINVTPEQQAIHQVASEALKHPKREFQQGKDEITAEELPGKQKIKPPKI